MPDLPRLLALDTTLKAAIIRAEQHLRAPKQHHVVKHKHGALVAALQPVSVAVARFLVWRSYLRAHKPTQASLMRAGHRLRGEILWRMGLLARAQGRTPLHAIPAFALATPRVVTRADTPDDGGDAATWWDGNAADTYGSDFAFDKDLYDTTLQQLTAAEKAQLLADVGQMLDFDNWLNNVFLTDLQVLQLLDASWNGATINAAGQAWLTEAGIAGDFDIVDTNMLNYLQRNAGVFVTKIDEVARQNLADALWKGLGGDGGQPLAMDALATYLQNNVAGKLAGMSDARARMIAITETARAESFGGYVAMLQSGVTQKIWIVTSGACNICITNAEQGPIDDSKIVETGVPTQYRVVPILEPFPSGHMAPPAHPLCRCTCTSAIPEGGVFSPNDWAYTPSNLQLDQLLSDPSFALWPQEVVDLSMPELKVAPDPNQVNLVQWQDLPDALKSVLSPAVLDGIKEQLGAATNVDDFMARLDALRGSTELPADFAPAPATSGDNPAPLGETPLMDAEQILQIFRDVPADSPINEVAQDTQDAFMQRFRDILGSIQDINNGEGDTGQRVQVAELTRDWTDLQWDEEQHPRGANGRFIGGNGMKAELRAYHLRDVLQDRADPRDPHIGWRDHLVTEKHGKRLLLQANREADAAARTLTQEQHHELQALIDHYGDVLHNDQLSGRTQLSYSERLRLQRMIEVAQAHLDRADKLATTKTTYIAHPMTHISPQARGAIAESVNYEHQTPAKTAADVFGRSLTRAELGAMLGGTITMWISTPTGIKVEVADANGRTGSFTFSRQSGALVANVGYVGNPAAHRSAASGREMLRAMQQLRGLGVATIATGGGRQDTGPPEDRMNGYYTWPRMGFVGALPPQVLPLAQAKFGSTVTTVEQIMAISGGAKWWKENGTPIDLTFDFTPGSASMQKFTQWEQAINRT